MLPQWIWKSAQAAVFVGLLVFFFESNDREIPMLACMVVALAVTAVIFAPLIHLQDRLLRRRHQLRSGQQLHEKRTPRRI
jgi:predicted branched-subunit amino acid permease